MKRRLALLVSAVLIVGLTFGLSFRQRASATVPGVNQLVSQDSSGNWSNGTSLIQSPHSVSGDGRYVVFTSGASNLVANDTNSRQDVFVRDTQNGTTTLADVSSSGVQADNGADLAAISYDGRYVVFQSTATNLVSGVSDGNNHIYERDLSAGTTTLVSVDGSTAVTGESPDVNADGRYVVFQTDHAGTIAISGFDGYSGFSRVAIKDMLTGDTQIVGGGPEGNSGSPTIDCDGHVIAFESGGVAGSGTPNDSDYQHGAYNFYVATIDWNTNPSKFVSNTSYPGQVTQPQVSCDGNYVVYNDSGSVREYNRLTGSYVVVNPSDNTTNTTSLYLRTMSVSDDGRYIAFTSGGTNLDSTYGSTGRGANYDVFVRDMKASSNQLVSFTISGNMSGLVPLSAVSISPDGSKVVYEYATPSSSGSGDELISGVDTGLQDIYESETGF